jgi:tetratricopeptide (TPR) repeat protein
MYKKLIIFAIFSVMFAFIFIVNTKNLAFGQATEPSFDASDNILDATFQEAQTALEKGQFETSLNFAKQALDHVQLNYNIISDERLKIHRLFLRIYEKQKNFAAAEKHFQQAYAIQKKIYGELHEHTLDMLAQSGNLYQKWGRQKELEKTLKSINSLYQKKYGINHKKTLQSINQLAGFYIDNEKYFKALPYVTQAVKVNTHLFGRHSIKNLAPMIQAAKTYSHCKSYDRAIKMFETALNVINKNRGKHSDTKLDIMQSLAKLHIIERNFKKAEDLYQKAIVLSKQIHGPRNKLLITFNEQLIEIYRSQGHLEKVKQQLKQHMELTSKILGNAHPKTIASQKALADFLFDQREYAEAASIYEDALHKYKNQYRTYDKTLSLSRRLAEIYIAQSQFQLAESLLKKNVDLYSNLLDHTRDNLQFLAQIYKQQGNCLDAIPLMDQVFRLNESTLGPSHSKTLRALSELIGCMVEEKRNLDALNLLKRIEPALFRNQWDKLCNKNIPVSDQTGYVLNAQNFCHAVLTLAHGMTDPEVIAYVADVMLRWQYLKHFPGAANKNLPGYHDINKLFQIRMVNLPYRLPRNSAFIHLSPYDVIDFSNEQSSQTRWVLVLILSEHEEVTTNMFMKDLGAVHKTQKLMNDLMLETSLQQKENIEKQLYKQLLGDFETYIQSVQSVYISTDGMGQMVPFSRFRLEAGQYWIKRQQVCRVFSALDFMKNITPAYTGSLLAVGQVNYDNYSQENPEQLTNSTESVSKSAANHIPLPDNIQLSSRYHTHTDETQIIENILTIYNVSRNATPIFLSDSNASESTLKNLSYPPRILHMSVDCFYLDASRGQMFTSRGGLALAGANQGIHKMIGPNGQDGLLLDYEILNMNLNGTELVCLTNKCDSKQASIHNSAYFQMAASFHMAGCRFVLSPIWKIKHVESSQFIILFYENWLRQSISNPSKALRATKLQCISKGTSPDIWGSFVLMGF